ncbi:energy transducer TonB [Parendozoicomonas sp. Alg238-R29]|uniref:energy transducer TonB n=1 Tax=Parendozoicomonas sp. Alg238-R29 TaxID=2993446 RepID=UPI00248D9448|nr:energy transducer TonB [Parendozoicomonas sp. Alg238-R29]
MLFSVALHTSAFSLWDKESAPERTISAGSYSAPVSLSFSVARKPVPEVPKVVPEVPKVVPEKPEPKPVVKQEPVIVEKSEVKVAKIIKQPKPEPVKPKPPEVVQEITGPEPRQVVEKTSEPVPAQTASTVVASNDQGLSEIPVVTEPAFRRPPSPPDYPRQSRRRNQEGTVLVEVLVDETGETLKVDVIESSGYPLLDRAAIKSVSRWAFQPKTVGSSTVISKVQVPVLFSLRTS